MSRFERYGYGCTAADDPVQKPMHENVAQDWVTEEAAVRDLCF
jgi:hypothetical protein